MTASTAPTAAKAADSASAAAKRTASRRAVPGVSRAARPRTARKSSIASRTAQPANHRQRSSVPTSESKARTFGAACVVGRQLLPQRRCPAASQPDARQVTCQKYHPKCQRRPTFRLRRMFPMRALYRRPQHRQPRAAQRRLCRPHQRPARRAVSAPPNRPPSSSASGSMALLPCQSSLPFASSVAASRQTA